MTHGERDEVLFPSQSAVSEELKAENAAILSFIRAAVAEYREGPFRSADWLAMQVMDALDGALIRPTPELGDLEELETMLSRRRADAESLDGFSEFSIEQIDALTTLISEVAALRERVGKLEADRRRYQWLVNAVLCCDYGDNEHGGAESPDRIGWAVRLSRRNAEPFIFGQSIDAAVDAALEPVRATLQDKQEKE